MINFHNHTTFSDGSFSPEEIVKAAIKSEIRHLGICDHFQTTKIPQKCVKTEMIDEYLSTLRKLRISYGAKINIYIGLEVDFSLLRTNLLSLLSYGVENFDYLLFEYVEDVELSGLSLDELVKIRNVFPVAVGLAHCDIEKKFGKEKFKMLAEKLQKNNIFLELSTALIHCRGITPYYYFAEDFFQEIKGKEVALSVGSDTHYEIKEVGNINNAISFIKQLHLSDNLNLLVKKVNEFTTARNSGAT